MTLNPSSNLINTKLFQEHYQNASFSLQKLHKYIIIFAIFFLLIFYTFLLHPSYYQLPSFFSRFQDQWSPSSSSTSPTSSPSDHAITIDDLMFCIAASLKTWKLRKPYIESWWEPNVTRGYVFFEEPPGEEFLPWPAKSPEFRVHEDVTKLDVFTRFNNPIQLRILRSVVETFKEADKDVKWFVMTDDDTVMVVENLLEVLAKYDYRKSYYIGMNSESVKSNVDFTFEMGFGGAGYALTYPLMEAIAEHLEGCLLRYTHLVSSDYIVSACVADLGIDPTFEKGFHQVDLHGDISGLLSAHPNAPFVSIHHMDTTEPIFPSKNRTESIHQLLRAAKLDRTRVLQQTICHHRPSHWSFSISWGYSLQIYESVFPRWLLKRPLETFLPWLPIAKPPFYMFNTRWPFDNPCEAPHAFFAESIKRIHNTEGEDEIVTTYVRKSPRNLQPCPLDGHQSAEPITKVQVFSPTTRNMEGIRDCCNVNYNAGANYADIRYRPCMKNEIIA